MIELKRVALALGTAAVLAWPAQAQDLAREVLEEYIGDMTASGLSVEVGGKSESGSTVEWNDIMVKGADGVDMVLAFVRAEEIGDGRVRLSYPETYDLTIDPEGEQPELTVQYRLSGVDHVVSGAKGARGHDMKAENLAMTIQAVDETLTMTIALSDIVAQLQRTGDAVPHYKGELKAAVLTIDQAMNDSDGGVLADFDYANLTAQLELDAIDPQNMAELLSGARSLDITYAVASGGGRMDIAQEEFNGTLTMQTGPSSVAVAVADGMARFATDSRDASYSFKMADLPLPPFDARIGKLGMLFEMPLKKSDTAAPGNIRLSLGDFVLSDTIWGMVDPAGSLPREAANLSIDLTAMLKWLVSPEEAAGMAAPPIQVDEVKINDLSLSVAGAAFTGSGAATLDNSTMPPMPVGEVNLELKGGIGLVDKLMAIGLLPGEQGQMIKMMSGVFAVPGDQGPDHLVTKIEMQEGGAIFANGQQVK